LILFGLPKGARFKLAKTRMKAAIPYHTSVVGV